MASVRMQEAQEVLLEGSDLTQTFDGQQYQFRGVDIQLPRGSKQGLVGVNGVGKSSLLRVLAGVDSPVRSCPAAAAHSPLTPSTTSPPRHPATHAPRLRSPAM